MLTVHFRDAVEKILAMGGRGTSDQEVFIPCKDSMNIVGDIWLIHHDHIL